MSKSNNNRNRNNNIKQEIKTINAEVVETQPKAFKYVLILSNINIKFGIYWIDGGIERKLTIKEYEENLYRAFEFQEELKKGNIKIEYR